MQTTKSGGGFDEEEEDGRSPDPLLWGTLPLLLVFNSLCLAYEDEAAAAQEEGEQW